ncbi:2'-5' RNA ligase family protein [Methanoregula sp. UBA64]|jgi:calcineurin-like phosphoesterase family protein|uniref:2'-5' RNA ligase family protein n=1 Tax=Methanoregula sp. UBA64 TaxID=1915554 RepID=UPI0025E7338C|nr:2'-5' RNA ligase family protein [Methanoregula sp. UBA64]
MAETYLVEIRLARTRWKIKELTRVITENAGIGGFRERHPHLTLYGPFTLPGPAHEQRLLDTIAAAAKSAGPLPFMIAGWECREGMHGGVVAFSLRPSQELAGLVREIARTLALFTESLNAWDGRPDEKWFHATIANRLPPGKAQETLAMMDRMAARAADPASRPSPAERIASLVRRVLFLHRHYTIPVRPVLLDDAGLRITVMHNEDILGEFDLLAQRWLTRAEIESPAAWQQSMASYRRSAGFEIAAPVSHAPDDILLISDLHFGHANIIRYCARPFVESDPGEMDRVLVHNWNACVGRDDRVCFLGDLSYWKDRTPDSVYRGMLNGRITYVAGNHDRQLAGTVPSVRLAYGGREFLLVHDPADADPAFGGWVIHGHYHNNELARYPFIDFGARRINVSAEVVGYAPVGLAEISRILDGPEHEKRMPLLLRYPYVR